MYKYTQKHEKVFTLFFNGVYCSEFYQEIWIKEQNNDYMSSAGYIY